MKHTITLCALLAVSFFYGCKKEKGLSNTAVNSDPFFDSSVQYLKSHLSQDEFDQLDFTKNKILTYKNQNVGVQIFEKGNNDDKFLLLENKNSNYSGNWVDVSGLNKGSSHYKAGNIILNSIDNISTTKLKVDSNKVVEMEKILKNNLTYGKTYFNKGKYPPKTGNASSLETTSAQLPEIIIYYDINGVGVDYYSWYWLLDQIPSSGYDYFNIGSSSGGSTTVSGSGYINVVTAPTFYSPDLPIADFNKELKCFSNNSTSTYNISVNVNQPDPGTRDIINPLSTFPVGHTYLTLEQHNADGSTIRRNVGFYPRNSVKPGSETDQSIFGEDSYTAYDVSLTFTVTGSEMNTVVGKLLDQQALQYDLNNFNCTNSAMDALKSININLPSTKADEPLFNGNDPGDLGEDIRNLNLTNFSSQNGNRKITRTVSNSDNQFPKGRTGSCG